MDDFVLSNLQESRNEWCSRLLSILCPLVIEGIRSIYNEAWKMCVDNGEVTKYLMTFQNLLSRIDKWNSVIVEEERKRIIERSGCNYLEDLITCVHIIQLKVLTCIRVGNKQKKIDISIPKLDHFIHKVYINVARKVYKNVYLFERNITSLMVQKNNRELEQIVQECILVAIRESIPTEAIIRAYMDESIEHEEEVIIENLVEPADKSADPIVQKTPEPSADPITPSSDKIEETIVTPGVKNLNEENPVTRISFNDYDSVLDPLSNKVENINAPKTEDRLEAISADRHFKRKLEEESDDDDDERIKIHTEPIDLSGFDILDMDEPPTTKMNPQDDNITLDIEELI
uniref:Uncharacterized protein n=1 Tax=viral metagenome TaxID=1070528 RepID=A0A6C0K002_9ZZZZ